MSASDAREPIRLRHIPFRKWIFGGVLVIFSLLNSLLLVRNILQTGGNPDDLTSTLLLIVLTVLLCACIWFYDSIKALIYPDVNEVIIDPNARSVDLTRYRIYGKRTDRFFFHQIEKFRSHKPKRWLRTRYFAEVILVNKKKIHIAIPIGDDKVEVTKLIKKLNKIIRSARSDSSPERDWNLG